ncbi:hypothetical protein RHMOL_Rhmol02G0044100 [Rhododendron molle]|uniref:Uncharacterized protein n=1 Tax=Rhododendron molle TaxID=49168 RepID=A0ACC0PLY1_RHOML|nr:hypothetical protein RHMOL_Rhmol02G0044100 [Rhododendron molle]
MQYQGCGQSMDNPPQNQEHNNIVDPPRYLAGDSALLQQQLRKNNQGFEESNMGFEEESEEEMMSCFYFPPSPTYFPLYRPMPTVFSVSSEQKNIRLALSCQHLLEDKSGELHTCMRSTGRKARTSLHVLLMYRDFFSYMVNKFGDLDQIASAASVLPENMQPAVVNIINRETHVEEVKLRRINWLEQKDEDNVGQLVFEVVGVVQQLIQNRGGGLDVIFGGGVFTLKCSTGWNIVLNIGRYGIVLNLGIGRRIGIGRGVSVSGRIGDTSRESGVAVVNF